MFTYFLYIFNYTNVRQEYILFRLHVTVQQLIINLYELHNLENSNTLSTKVTFKLKIKRYTIKHTTT